MTTNGRLPLAILLLFIAMLTLNTASAETITVCSSGCDNTTIQDAVDYAVAGDTILIGEGIYTEQVLIDKSLNLIGSNAEVRLPDSGLVSHNWNSGNYPTIGVDTTTGVNISGFVINSTGHDTGSYSGVHYWKSSGNVSDCIFYGYQDAIISNHVWDVSYPTHVDIINNQFNVCPSGCNGITCTEMDSDCYIYGNTVEGVSTSNIGIQVGYGATGDIVNNTVSGFSSSGSACIMLSGGVDGSTISYNMIDDCDSGIFLYYDGDYGYGGNDNTDILHNTISNCAYGLYIGEDSIGTTIGWNTMTDCDTNIYSGEAIDTTIPELMANWDNYENTTVRFNGTLAIPTITSGTVNFIWLEDGGYGISVQTNKTYINTSLFAINDRLEIIGYARLSDYDYVKDAKRVAVGNISNYQESYNDNITLIESDYPLSEPLYVSNISDYINPAYYGLFLRSDSSRLINKTEFGDWLAWWEDENPYYSYVQGNVESSSSYTTGNLVDISGFVAYYFSPELYVSSLSHTYKIGDGICEGGEIENSTNSPDCALLLYNTSDLLVNDYDGNYVNANLTIPEYYSGHCEFIKNVYARGNADNNLGYGLTDSSNIFIGVPNGLWNYVSNHTDWDCLSGHTFNIIGIINYDSNFNISDQYFTIPIIFSAVDLGKITTLSPNVIPMNFMDYMTLLGDSYTFTKATVLDSDRLNYFFYSNYNNTHYYRKNMFDNTTVFLPVNSTRADEIGNYSIYRTVFSKDGALTVFQSKTEFTNLVGKTSYDYMCVGSAYYQITIDGMNTYKACNPITDYNIIDDGICGSLESYIPNSWNYEDQCFFERYGYSGMTGYAVAGATAQMQVLMIIAGVFILLGGVIAIARFELSLAETISIAIGMIVGLAVLLTGVALIITP